MSTSSFFLQLVIISTFVQTAADVTKRSTDTNMSKKDINQRKLETNIYCASKSLYITRGQLQNAAAFTLPSLPLADMNNCEQNVTSQVPA